MRSPMALVLAAVLVGWGAAGPFGSADDEPQQETRRLHVVRQQRAHNVHCREAARLARETARSLRESAQRQPLRTGAVLQLRDRLAEQLAELAAEHNEFVASLTPAQATLAKDKLAYMEAVERQLQQHLSKIQDSARAGPQVVLVRHCRILERDLRDWSDRHAAISDQLGIRLD